MRKYAGPIEMSEKSVADRIERTAHLSKFEQPGMKLVAWHTSLDIAGYEGDGKSYLVIKGQIFNGMQEVAPIGTQIACLCRYTDSEAKLIVKLRYQIDL